MKITTTRIKKLKPCPEGLAWYQAHGSPDLLTTLQDVIKAGHPEWASWLYTRLMTPDQRCQIAIFAAEQVLPLFEREYPNDKRPRLAIEAAKSGVATTEDAASAADAAYAARASAPAAQAAVAASTACASACASAAYVADASAYASAAYAYADAADAARASASAAQAAVAARYAAYASADAADAAYAAYDADADAVAVAIATEAVRILDSD